MRDFDKDWQRMQRQGRWISGAASAFIGLAFIGVVVLIGAAAYWGATTTPEDIGEFFGKMKAGFDRAALSGNGQEG